MCNITILGHSLTFNYHSAKRLTESVRCLHTCLNIFQSHTYQALHHISYIPRQLINLHVIYLLGTTLVCTHFDNKDNSLHCKNTEYL
jgi:hypothetical protein